MCSDTCTERRLPWRACWLMRPMRAAKLASLCSRLLALSAPCRAMTAVLRANRQLAERLQISGTPAFVIGGDMIKGYVPLATLQEVVAAERG